MFLCIENSCRSQILKLFAKKYGEGKVNALSAGSHPSGHINEKAVLLCERKGDYDLNSHSSTGTNDLPEGGSSFNDIHGVLVTAVQQSRQRIELSGIYQTQKHGIR